MRQRIVLITILGVLAFRGIDAQITANPFPAPLEKRGLAVEIRDVVRLPETRGMRPADQDVNPVGLGSRQFRA